MNQPPSSRRARAQNREPLTEDPESLREIVHGNILFLLAGALVLSLGAFALVMVLAG